MQRGTLETMRDAEHGEEDEDETALKKQATSWPISVSTSTQA